MDGLLQLQEREQDVDMNPLQESFSHFNHRRPLFLEVEINGVLVRRALVDTSSSINIVLKAVLEVAKIPLRKFTVQRSQYLYLVIYLNLWRDVFNWI